MLKFSRWQCACGVAGVADTDPGAMKAYTDHKNSDRCGLNGAFTGEPSNENGFLTERERSLHRDLVAAQRDLSIANARVEVGERTIAAMRARAEAAEDALSARKDEPTERRTDCRNIEDGAGIGSPSWRSSFPPSRRDNSVAWLDEDLLCEDA